MSSPDPRTLARLALALGLSVALAGCFRPVYGDVSTTTLPTKTEGADVASRMAAIEVKPIEGRVGYKLRNELIFALRGGAGAGPVGYRLTIDRLERRAQTPIVEPLTDVPQTSTITYAASYTLTRSGSLDPVLHGETIGTATYFSGLQRFANLRAARDAEDRIALQLVERIRARLLAYFSAGR